MGLNRFSYIPKSRGVYSGVCKQFENDSDMGRHFLVHRSDLFFALAEYCGDDCDGHSLIATVLHYRSVFHGVDYECAYHDGAPSCGGASGG